MFNIKNLNAFIAGYMEAALFAETATTQDGEDLEHLDGYEFNALATHEMRHHCAEFMDRFPLLLAGVTAAPDYGYIEAGRDLWFTRQGHGVGFWDRGLGKPGDALSDAARSLGELSLYIDDNGQVGIA